MEFQNISDPIFIKTGILKSNFIVLSSKIRIKINKSL